MSCLRYDHTGDWLAVGTKGPPSSFAVRLEGAHTLSTHTHLHKNPISHRLDDLHPQTHKYALTHVLTQSPGGLREFGTNNPITGARVGFQPTIFLGLDLPYTDSCHKLDGE